MTDKPKGTDDRARVSVVLEQVRQAFAARKAPTPGGGLAGILAGIEALADRAERAEAERDEARRDKRDMGAIIADTLNALEGDPHDNVVGLARALRGDLKRAEAANAELLGRLQALQTSVAGPIASMSDEHLQALRDACRKQHKPGVGGAAVCACGMSGGGTRACSLLRTIITARAHAQELADALKGTR